MKIDKLGELNDSPKKFNEPQYVQERYGNGISGNGKVD